MKKIFTLVMLSILTVVNVNAAEKTLWEGSKDINWGESNVLIASADMADVPVGAKITLSYELVDMPEHYHAMRITTNWWGDNPEDQVVAQFDLPAETPNTFVFTYTEANKAIVDVREGMLIVGYGYKLTKVVATYEGGEPVTIDDLDPVVLWQGEQTLADWSGDAGVKLNFEEKGITKACNLYLLISNYESGNLRLVRNSGWVEYPSDNYDHLQNVDADNVVKVALTQEFVTGVVESEYKEIVFWGNGVTVKAIGTTKAIVLNPTSINNVASSVKNDTRYYNLNGQVVANPTKGLYIVNGKKVLMK